MKRRILGLTVFFLLVAIASFFYVSTAEAWIKITLKNNRSHNISVAFCWSGFDFAYDQRKGWYVVKPGESRVITLADAVAAMTWDGFGFYAQGRMQNGNRVTWSGDMKQVIIHPSKAFSGHPDDPIQGGTRVGFRQVKLNRVGDSSTDAVATLTFNP